MNAYKLNHAYADWVGADEYSLLLNLNAEQELSYEYMSKLMCKYLRMSFHLAKTVKELPLTAGYIILKGAGNKVSARILVKCGGSASVTLVTSSILASPCVLG